MRLINYALAAISLLSSEGAALTLDPKNPDSVNDVAKKIAGVLVPQYATIDNTGIHVLGGYPGILYRPYYWWHAGAMFGTLLDYWYYTGDATYNKMVREGLIFNFGENLDLLPKNQSKEEGNDDQVFWAFTMIAAAEYKFPDPPPNQPGWLAMTQSVFNQFAARFSKEVSDQICGGGMRWQIYPIKGYQYKNTASNGGLFHLGARLAMYTKNDTYAAWAEKAYDWMANSPLIESNGIVNDGIDIDPDCKNVHEEQWTYNYGILIAGAAYMYNYTNGANKWKNAMMKMIDQVDRFYPDQLNGVLYEPCEPNDDNDRSACSADSASFKGYLARWLAVTMQMAPITHDRILPKLQKSAIAAAQTCQGDAPKGGGSYQCSTRWYKQGYTGGNFPVSQQIAALNTIAVMNVDRVPPPYSSKTGGTSQGNPGLGNTGIGDDALKVARLTPIKTADKAGAAILTILLIISTLGGAYFMIV